VVRRGTNTVGPKRLVGSSRVIVKPTRGLIPRVPPGHVVFVADNPSVTVVCRLGAQSASRSGGVGGWEDVDRPGRHAGTEWTSTPAVKLDVPILLDRLATRQPVESEIAALHLLGEPPANSERGTPPPVVRLGGMVPHDNREWVIEDIAGGDAVWVGMVRVRWWATVTLTAFEPLDVIKITRKKKGKRAATRVYVVKRGDSLGSIARDELDAKTAKAIANGVATLKRLNKLRDPKSIKVGQKLKVPR